jgi:hypothetical protein
MVLSMSNHGQETTSKCHFLIPTSSPSTDVTHSWPNDVDVYLDNVAWSICSTYHTVLKSSPNEAIFGCNMFFNVPFVANWNKIGD